MTRERPMSIIVYMSRELIAAIDQARGFQSRSDWIRQAARNWLGVVAVDAALEARA